MGETVAASDAPPVFALPPALLSQGYALRAEIDADLPFLMRVFAATREAELANVPWSDAQKQAFLASQFQAQRHYYRTMLAACHFGVLEHEGTPIGRLYLEARQTSLYIVDIAFLPDYCGRGIGGAILQALQEEAGARGLGVSIMVEKFNPALRLYRRLGFTGVTDHDVYLEMEWVPFVPQTNVHAVS